MFLYIKASTFLIFKLEAFMSLGNRISVRKAKMLMFICIIASFLQLTQAACSKGCWADPQNAICVYDTALQGREGMMISYYLKIPFSRICCKALTCRLATGTCVFEDAGCHDNTTVSSMTTPKPWELPNIPTIMRCKGNGAFYWFTPNVVDMKTVYA